MTGIQEATSGWATAMRWVARLLGLVAVGLFALFISASGASVLPALTWSSPQGVPLLLFLLAALVGVLIAWRRELVGGVMAVVGAVGILALVCLGSGFDMLLCALFFTLPLLIAGILYLGCCWKKRTTTSPQGA
ncbi:MAG: hypothetical protein PVH17_05025 [Anaerolineae bacterium]